MHSLPYPHLLLALLLALFPLSGRADEPAVRLTPEWLKPLTWRCIGPANMGGRIVAVAVNPQDASTWWVATASGGLLKTTNNGVTFEHQLDRESTVSIGDVCCAPSNPNVVWVGTGENNPRNSVSYGDGVYKSTDGGKSWKCMGLKESFQIGRIAIHPTNPDVVYVGALGRLYGPNPERGLFKTSDGGKTWQKILFVDDRTGVIDLRMHPTEPDTLLVATYERQRDELDVADPVKKWGAGSGLYRTTDGGQTWQKITKGLPTCKLGRIGLDWYRKDPRTVFMILESEKIGLGPPRAVARAPYLGITGEDLNVPGDKGAQLVRITRGGPADRAGLRPNDVLVALDGKAVASYQDLLAAMRGHKPGDKVKVRFRRGKEVKEVELTFAARSTAPGQAGRPYAATLGGQVENAQQGAESYQYGGVYKSTDGGASWTRINSLNPRPMYFSQVRADPNDDKRVYVLGISLYRSQDGGKTFKPDGGRGIHGDHHALWIDPRDGRRMILGGDGGVYVTWDRMRTWDHFNHVAIAQFYHVAVDPRRLYRVYGGLQDNGSWGGPGLTRGPAGPVNDDWVLVSGGDGFTCRVDPKDPDLVYSTSQYGRMRRRNLRTGAVATIAPRGGQRYRFNWNTPFVLSARDSRVFYAAGNVVFRSPDRGNDLKPISPGISRTERGSATALAESPRNAAVLWVGTDDGFLWVTRDGGKKWSNVIENVRKAEPSVGGRYPCVAAIEASRFAEGRAYVVLDGHRTDDDQPHVLVTEDCGQTWRSLRANLPWGSTRCLSEDLERPDLLYLGTEFGAWCSLDRGRSWHRLNANLPTVAVHEFAQHPTSGEVVAATHGRSLWVLDVSALRQLSPTLLAGGPHLLRPSAATRWRAEPTRGRTLRRFVGENPPPARFYYALSAPAKTVRLRVLDAGGKVVREWRGAPGPGLHRLDWNLTAPPTRPSGQRPRPAPATRRPLPGQPIAPGAYRVVLVVDGKEFRQPLQVLADPAVPPGEIAEHEGDTAEGAEIDD